mgnify:CR=1 FL=1
MPKSDSTLNFEKSYAELEAIVAELESGKFSIDDSVKKFERGLTLAQSLKKKLTDVEKKVETMKASFSQEDGDAVS